jgi:poly-gamma-glutamate capsule biosynthesis protein CapA/YwtB (metallophosphatase superfamily)
MRPALLALPLLLGACASGTEPSPGGAPAPAGPPPVPYSLLLAVVDEAGAPVPSATLNVAGTDRATTADGALALSGLTDPVAVVATAPGFVPEPAVLGPEQAGAPYRIRLRRELGPGGARRTAMHFGGDVMLGRRYLAPAQPDTAVVTTGDGGASARAVVSSLAPLFRAAHFRCANLETVIGTLPASGAYPRKRYLLQSPPELVSALRDLGLDLAVLGNNHVRDWLEPGIASTLASLSAGGIPTVGAGVSEAEAAVPVLLEVAGLTIGVLSYTTINGDAVNDSYPDDAAAVPANLPDSDAWRYEFRNWGFTGASVTIPAAARRLGSAWSAIRGAEPSIATPDERAALWASARTVYPELQDWVARRGHGGANPLELTRIPRDVASLRARGAELVIVQLHTGFQYSEVASTGTAQGAHRAIDAGADLVISHHTHVQQGFEFYRGKLVCFSLGNCVFDQDFLSTFLSGVLRVVYEGTELIEARFLPMTLLRYRPVPVVGASARAVVRVIHEHSSLDARTDRYDGAARMVLRAPVPNAAKPVFRLEGNAALLFPGPGASSAYPVTASFDAAADLPQTGIVRSRGSGLTGVLFGRDLFRWGAFEDDAADGVAAGGPQWSTTGASDSAGIWVTAGTPSPDRALRLHRTSSNTSRVRIRPVARMTLTEHRFWTEVGPASAVPADGTPSYSLRFQARRSGSGETFFTLDVYHFDDLNPSEDPESTLLRTVELPFSVPPDGQWRELIVDVPESAVAPAGGLPANAIMMYVGLNPPASGESELRMDDLQFLEWRAPDSMPDGFFEVVAVRAATPGTTVSAVLERREE